MDQAGRGDNGVGQTNSSLLSQRNGPVGDFLVHRKNLQICKQALLVTPFRFREEVIAKHLHVRHKGDSWLVCA